MPEKLNLKRIGSVLLAMQILVAWICFWIQLPFDALVSLLVFVNLICGTAYLAWQKIWRYEAQLSEFTRDGLALIFAAIAWFAAGLLVLLTADSLADITVSLGAVRIWSFAVIFGLVLLWLLGGFLSLLRLSKFAQKKSWQSVLNRVLLMAVLVAACFGAIFAWAHFISAEYPVWYDAVFLGLVSLSMLVIVFGLMRVSLSYPRILFILGWITIVGSICFWYLIQVFLLLTICGKFGCF